MIKLTAHLGSNPLRFHKPIRCITPPPTLTSQQNYIYSVGESGEVLAWNK